MPKVYRWRQARNIACVSMASVFVANCSLMDPYVRVDQATLKKLDDNSLAGAFEYATLVQDGYNGAISEHAMLNSSVGLALIPVTALAAYYGITGGHGNTILALGLGGAGTYLGASYLHSEPRQFIYAAGAKAIECSMGVMRPLLAVDKLGKSPSPEGTEPAVESTEDTFQERTNTLSARTEKLQVILSSARIRLGETDPEVVDGLGELDQARALQTDANKLLARLREGSGGLLTAVKQIEATITQAIIATEPDLSQLVNTLGTAIPHQASVITNTAVIKSSPEPDPGIKKDARSVKVVTREDLATARAQLASSVSDVGAIVDQVRNHSPADALIACGASLDAIAPKFEVSPQAPIVFSRAAETETTTLFIRGGKPKYALNWGNTAPTDIDLKLDNVWDDTLVVRVTETLPNAKDGQYSLIIKDTTDNEVAINVTVKNVAAATSSEEGGGGGTPTPPNPPEEDPRVSALQTLLKENGHDIPKVDGILGEKTLGAMQLYTNHMSMTLETAPNQIDSLTNELTEIKTGYAILNQRNCLASANVPKTRAEVEEQLDEATSKFVAAHPDPDPTIPSTATDVINKLANDSTLTCP